MQLWYGCPCNSLSFVADLRQGSLTKRQHFFESGMASNVLNRGNFLWKRAAGREQALCATVTTLFLYTGGP